MLTMNFHQSHQYISNMSHHLIACMERNGQSNIWPKSTYHMHGSNEISWLYPYEYYSYMQELVK